MHFSGSATSDGVVNRSLNGVYVTVTGYLAPERTPGVVNAVGINRCVVRVDGAGTVDQTTIVSDAYQSNNLRSAATVDGTNYWLAGATIDAGVRLVVHGSSGASTGIYSIITNARVTSLTSSGLYVSTGTGSVPDGGFSRVIALRPAPISATSSQIYLSGVNLTGPQGLAVLDLNIMVAGDDTAYIVDTAGAGGVRKYTFDGSVWTERAQFILGVGGVTLPDGGVSATTCLQVAAKQVGPDVVLLCTTSELHSNRVVRFVDVGGGSTGQPPGTTLTTAPTFQVYRGVAFSPQ